MPFPGNATPELVRKVRKFARTHYWFEVCEELGISKATHARIRYWYGIKESRLIYPDDVVKKVCEYYAVHGRVKTQKKFKNVKVRSIAERYMKSLDLPPRLIPWTSKQMINLCRMQGIVPYKYQADFFNRPRAHEGSIKAFWWKRMHKEGFSLNGLATNSARFFLNRKHLDPIRLGLKTRGKNAGYELKGSRRIITWVDLSKNLDPELPDHLKEVIRAMAKFQQWLHGVKNVRSRVQKLTNASTPEKLSRLLRV